MSSGRDRIKKDFENIKRTMPEIIQEDYLKELGVLHEKQVKKEVSDWLESEELLKDTGVYDMLSYKVLSLQSEIGELQVEIEKALDKKNLFEDKYVQHILQPKMQGLESELARIRFQLEKMQKARGTQFKPSTWDDKKKRASERTYREVVEPHLEKIRVWKNYVLALCPFHDEKTPSFRWHHDGRFKCFGCGAGGAGVIKFWMLYKKIDFKQAVEELS